MKIKFALLPAALIVAGSSFLVTSCSKDEDTTPPVVTLNGDPSPVLSLQTNFVDLGAIANDEKDGSLAVTVDGTVDKNQVGNYTLTYSATDLAGNTGTAIRTVTYKNDLVSDPFEGAFSCTITSTSNPPYTYSENLLVSKTLNNGLEWSKFGDYSNANARLNILFGASNQVIVPTQTIICGTPAVARTFSGSGTKSGTGAPGDLIVLNIDETVNGVTGSFVYTYTKQ